MKIISQEDLLLLIPKISRCDSPVWDLRDFEIMLEEYGDDYYIVDGRFQLARRNDKMQKLKEVEE